MSLPTADLRLRRGAFFLARGWHQNALKEFRAALRIRRAKRADDPVGHAMTLLAIARAHADGGEAVRSWWACRNTLSAVEADRGRDHPDTAAVLEAIARYHSARSLRSASRRLLKRAALAIRERPGGFDAPEAIATALLFASIDQASGRLDRAAATYGRVDRSLSARLGPQHPEGGPVALGPGDDAPPRRSAVLVRGAPYRRALAIFTAADGPDSPRPAGVAFSLGTLLTDLGRPVEAESLLRRTVDALHAIHGGDHPEAVLAMSHLASVLRKLRRRDEAEALDRRARAARSRAGG